MTAALSDAVASSEARHTTTRRQGPEVGFFIAKRSNEH